MTPINRDIVSTIYQLKRDYGFQLWIYRRTQTLEVETGNQSYSVVRQEVKRAIQLPTDWKRKFAYDLSFVAANKNFTYGGFFDVNVRDVLIDASDLPKGFEITPDDEVMSKTERYHIVSVSRIEETRIWMLQIKQTAGEKPFRIIDLKGKDRIAVEESTDVNP